MVVSLFGESDTDRRDYRMGLAGLLAGTHALRILAERGIASSEDIGIARQGVADVLAGIPESELPAAQREQLVGMLDRIAAVAARNDGQGR